MKGPRQRLLILSLDSCSCWVTTAGCKAVSCSWIAPQGSLTARGFLGRGGTGLERRAGGE